MTPSQFYVLCINLIAITIIICYELSSLLSVFSINCVCVRVFMCVCVCVRAHVYVRVHVYVHMCAHTCVHICV